MDCHSFTVECLHSDSSSDPQHLLVLALASTVDIRVVVTTKCGISAITLDWWFVHWQYWIHSVSTRIISFPSIQTACTSTINFLWTCHQTLVSAWQFLSLLHFLLSGDSCCLLLVWLCDFSSWSFSSFTMYSLSLSTVWFIDPKIFGYNGVYSMSSYSDLDLTADSTFCSWVDFSFVCVGPRFQFEAQHGIFFA